MNTKCLILVGLMILFATAAFGQSGGSFAITQSVVAAGGGAAGGGAFEVTGTTGQNVAGTTSSGVPFAVHSGFWSGTLTPSAAAVRVSAFWNSVPATPSTQRCRTKSAERATRLSIA